MGLLLLALLEAATKKKKIFPNVNPMKKLLTNYNSVSISYAISRILRSAPRLL